MNILFICIFFIASKRNSARGKAVSSNGKFATINGLKLYYEESGELLTTKRLGNRLADGTTMNCKSLSAAVSADEYNSAFNC